jgi:hypothetical protein
MTMLFNSLSSFATHLVTVEADVKLACDAAVVKASKLVAKTGQSQPQQGPSNREESQMRKLALGVSFGFSNAPLSADAATPSAPSLRVARGRAIAVRRIDRFSTRLALAGIALALAAVGPALAGNCPSGTIYATGFENPPFTAGPPFTAATRLVGQDGWVGVPPLSPSAAVISTDLYFSGLQSVRVLGQDLVHQDFINTLTGGYYDAIGSYRKPVTCDPAAGFPIVRVTANVRIDGPTTPPGGAAQACTNPQPSPSNPCHNFFSASVAARAGSTTNGTAGIGELAISSDGKAYGYSGDDNVPTFLTSLPVSLGAWHTLEVDADFGSRTFSFALDGKTLPGGPFSFPNTADTNTLVRGSFVVYAAPDTTQLKKSNYAAHYDNFSIATEGTSQASAQLRPK